MEHHVGIDVSLELSSLCVLDSAGKPISEAKVPSEPEVLVAFLSGLGLPIGRVGLEYWPVRLGVHDQTESVLTIRRNAQAEGRMRLGPGHHPGLFVLLTPTQTDPNFSAHL
jgi:hypothetical protein